MVGKLDEGNLHVQFDVAGAGNVAMVELCTHRAIERARLETLHLQPARLPSTLLIIGCELEEDARRIKEVLPKRFAKYGLEITTEKTPVVDFGRPQRSSASRQPGTFSLLGFVHYWGKTWRGGHTIKRKTEGKRLRRTLGAFWRWCQDNRHRPLQEQYALLCAKLRGYCQYDGIRCNSRCLDLVYYTATRAWRYWLNRRGGRKMTWRAFGRMMAAYALPRPKIVKAWV